MLPSRSRIPVHTITQNYENYKNTVRYGIKIYQNIGHWLCSIWESRPPTDTAMQSEHSTLLNQLSSVAPKSSPLDPSQSCLHLSSASCLSWLPLICCSYCWNPSFPWFLGLLLLLHWSSASCLSWLPLIQLQLLWEPILHHGSSLPPTPVCVYIIVVCYKIRYRTNTNWNETTFCGCPCTLALWRPHYVLPATMFSFGNPSVPVVPCSSPPSPSPPSCECFSYCCVLDTR